MNELLVKSFIKESELIDNKDIENIELFAKENNISFLDALIQKNILTQEMLTKISSSVLGIPKIELGDKMIPFDVLELLPPSISLVNDLIVFDKKGNTLHIAFADLKAIELLDSIYDDSIDFKLYYTDRDDIIIQQKRYKKYLFDELYNSRDKFLDKAKTLDDLALNEEELNDLPNGYLKDILEIPELNNFVENIIKFAVTSYSNYIYFEMGEKEVRVDFRVFGKSFPVIYFERKYAFPIFSKIKELSDIKILEKSRKIQAGSFDMNIDNLNINIRSDFRETDQNVFVTLELKYASDLFYLHEKYLTREQKDFFNNAGIKKAGINIITGSDYQKSKKTLYSFLEREIKRGQVTVSLEKEILQQIPFVNQLDIDDYKKTSLLLHKTIENKPDVLSIEKITKTSFFTIFNYSLLFGKTFLNIKNNAEKIVSWVFNFGFKKGLTVKNFNYFISNYNFKDISNLEKKTYKLKKKDIKILEKFVKEDELEIILGEKKKFSNLTFYTKKNKLFGKSKKTNEKINIVGIFNLGLVFENGFLEKKTEAEIQNEVIWSEKKAILENALLASSEGDIDIWEVLKYLTK